MEEIFRQLTREVLDQVQRVPQESRFIIGIAGIPGSGKTTLAKEVTRRLNESLAEQQHSTRALMLGMDGYHFSRAQLDQFEDPQRAYARRGAAFTIDGQGLADLIRHLKVPLADLKGPILAPSFDHEVKDPVQDDIVIERHHKIILVEGLYLHVNQEPWTAIAESCDQLWFIKVNMSTARKRIVERHLLTGIYPDRPSAEDRADQNDLPNGQWIEHNAIIPDKTIISIEDTELQP